MAVFESKVGMKAGKHSDSEKRIILAFILGNVYSALSFKIKKLSSSEDWEFVIQWFTDLQLFLRQIKPLKEIKTGKQMTVNNENKIQLIKERIYIGN